MGIVVSLPAIQIISVLMSLKKKTAVRLYCSKESVPPLTVKRKEVFNDCVSLSLFRKMVRTMRKEDLTVCILSESKDVAVAIRKGLNG